MKDDMILYQYDTKKVEKEKKNFHEKFTFFWEEITQNTHQQINVAIYNRNTTYHNF